MGPHNLTKFQTDTIILTSSKVGVTLQKWLAATSLGCFSIFLKVRMELSSKFV